jgi:hypothetical protein
MLPGTYPTPLTVAAGMPFSVVASGAVMTAATMEYCLSVTAGANVSIRDFASDANTCSFECRGAATRLNVSDSDLGAVGTFHDCTATLTRVTLHGFFDVVAATVDVDSSVLFAAGEDTAIDVNGSPSFTVRNSVIGGVSVADGGSVLFEYNTIYSNAGVVQAASPFTGVTFRNNILVSTGTADSARCSSCTFVNNVVSPQSTALPGNLIADPKFVNAGTDFHLMPGSPAIDTADTATDDHDLDGTHRPYGSAADVGAYEFHP